MELNLPALATTCHVSGEPFNDGERIVSELVREAATGQVVRFDMKLAAEERFEAPGRVACRWVHTFKPKVAGQNAERELKLTAETLFLTLADPAAELSTEDARLVQFLALMLERKRLLKPRGRSADGTKNVFEHAKTKQRFEVPAGELDPEFFIAVQEQLSVLVGEPDKSTPASEAAPATPAVPEPPPAAI